MQPDFKKKLLKLRVDGSSAVGWQAGQFCVQTEAAIQQPQLLSLSPTLDGCSTNGNSACYLQAIDKLPL